MRIEDKEGNITEITKPIIFFDGVCGLCNSFVDFVLKIDNDQKFYYSPIQGETAKRFLSKLDDDPLEWSIVYVDDKGMHSESSASLRAFKYIGGMWGVLGIFLFVPEIVRNSVYRFVAKNRYKWFGKRDTCRLPTPEERNRFLD